MARKYLNDVYRIVRSYQADGRRGRTIKRGLTLAEAQAHCRGTETSSSTCTTAAGRRRTRQLGPWFDGYSNDYTGR